MRHLLAFYVTGCATTPSESGSTGGSHPTGHELPSELAAPAPGEWPMFKRSLDHRGLADDLTGDFAGEACVWWDRPITGDGTRGCGGAVVGVIDGAPTVYVATDGWCSDDRTECTSGFDAVNYLPIPGVPGKVWALAGATGEVRWSWRADDDEAQFDPYAPLLADLDGDGARELVVPSTNSRWIYTFDAAEGGGGWSSRADLGDGRMSEAAPAAADLDGDGRLEILIGDDAQFASEVEGARFHAFDPDGSERSSIDVPNRACRGGRKIDSSQPAVAEVDGQAIIVVGAWDGALWAFGWDDGLVERWQAPIPPRSEADCPVGKVRNSPVVADLDGDSAPEVTFSSMYEETEGGTEMDDAVLRVVDLATGDPVRDGVRGDWKSSPSAADLDGTGGLELVGGSVDGVWATDANLEELWLAERPLDRPVPGNRSSPAVADLDRDGFLDVVIGLEGTFGPDDPAVVALDGRTGEPLWEVAYGVESSGTCSSPALADLDGDGTLEVVVAGRDGVLRAIGRCSH